MTQNNEAERVLQQRSGTRVMALSGLAVLIVLALAAAYVLMSRFGKVRALEES